MTTRDDVRTVLAGFVKAVAEKDVKALVTAMRQMGPS